MLAFKNSVRVGNMIFFLQSLIQCFQNEEIKQGVIFKLCAFQDCFIPFLSNIFPSNHLKCCNLTCVNVKNDNGVFPPLAAIRNGSWSY